ncbi:hypothetical protein RRG08_062744 [Elysia crispata]|uniref:Uncharacterized protein n=1 Tax=Elysia crispata TaxID=231223 RepID=A0AAE0YM29_9GAST|nr:hypothetical protein RRG08_062744 [Elysia crispata]
MTLPDNEENSGLTILHSSARDKLSKTVGKVDLTAVKCEDKEVDDDPDNTDSSAVVGDDGNDKRMANGREGDGEEEKGVVVVDADDGDGDDDDDDDGDETATQQASDYNLGAEGGDLDTDADGFAADSQSGEYVSGNVLDSATASNRNPSASYGVAVDNINVFNLGNEDFKALLKFCVSAF